MKLATPSFIFLILFTSVACSRRFDIARVVPGKTSIQKAIKLLDEPQLAHASQGQEEEQIYIWKDVTLQVKNDVVSAIHRKPAGHEKDLQFWHQYYKNEDSKFQKIQSNPQDHLWQLNIPGRGMNIVYDEKTDEVVRVVLYEVQ